MGEYEFWKIVTNLDARTRMTERPDMPNMTQPQIVAVAQSLVAVLVAFGAPLTDVQTAAVLGLVAVVSAALMHSDARVREARNASYQMEMAEETARMDQGELE